MVPTRRDGGLPSLVALQHNAVGVRFAGAPNEREVPMPAKKRTMRAAVPAAATAHTVAKAMKTTAAPDQSRQQEAAAVQDAKSATYADLASFGQDNLAAIVHANAALVKGFEEIGQEVYGFARNSLDRAMSAARALIGAGSLGDVIALNRDFAERAFEGLVANSARVSSIGIRATTEALTPLGERVVTAIEQLNRQEVA